MSETDDALVEAMARAMAITDGCDPDEPAYVRYPGPQYIGKCWLDKYANRARAALAIARVAIQLDEARAISARLDELTKFNAPIYAMREIREWLSARIAELAKGE